MHPSAYDASYYDRQGEPHTSRSVISVTAWSSFSQALLRDGIGLDQTELDWAGPVRAGATRSTIIDQALYLPVVTDSPVIVDRCRRCFTSGSSSSSAAAAAAAAQRHFFPPSCADLSHDEENNYALSVWLAEIVIGDISRDPSRKSNGAGLNNNLKEEKHSIVPRRRSIPQADRMTYFAVVTVGFDIFTTRYMYSLYTDKTALRQEISTASAPPFLYLFKRQMFQIFVTWILDIFYYVYCDVNRCML